MDDSTATGPRPGSYQPRTALEKHCAFFDLDRDGQLTPWDTFSAFKLLGYSVLLSLVGTVVVHLFLSYPTLDTWIPDPFFTVHLKNIHRCRHGSDTAIYSEGGDIQKDRASYILSLFTVSQATSKGGEGMGLWDGIRMVYHNRDAWDIFGWSAQAVEWYFLWALCADSQGKVSREAIMRQYDGTLFYEIAEERQRK